MIQHHVLINLLSGITQGWLVLQFDSSWAVQTQMTLWLLVISIVAITIRSHGTDISDRFACSVPILPATLFELETAGRG